MVMVSVSAALAVGATGTGMLTYYRKAAFTREKVITQAHLRTMGV